MSKSTLYTCDRCKKEGKTGKAMTAEKQGQADAT